MHISLKQAPIQIRVNKDRNLDKDVPNPKHTGVIIRGLLDRRDPVLETLYQDTLASLLDAIVTQQEFELLTIEEIGILKEWNSDHQRLSHARKEFLTRFGIP